MSHTSKAYSLYQYISEFHNFLCRYCCRSCWSCRKKLTHDKILYNWHGIIVYATFTTLHFSARTYTLKGGDNNNSLSRNCAFHIHNISNIHTLSLCILYDLALINYWFWCEKKNIYGIQKYKNTNKKRKLLAKRKHCR